MAKITVIPGDGIGPEVIRAGVRVLNAAAVKYGCELELVEALAGGAAIDACGTPLPPETIAQCKASDAVLLGAVGGLRWDHLPSQQRPEKAILGLRQNLGLFANLRPVVLYPSLAQASPLKPALTEKGIDLVIVRELTGGIYFGPRQRIKKAQGEEAWDTEIYSTSEITRIARLAFRLAAGRRGKVTSVDKANVLASSRLWRDVVDDVAKAYPEVHLQHMYVDNCAMQLIREPRQFDVILTANLFGDILSDEAAVLTGSIGMLPSASLRQDTFGLYEPSHGSAPDIAGQDKANPLATILSVALLFRFSLERPDAARGIEQAVGDVLAAGYRTPDIWAEGLQRVGTAEMGDLVINALMKL